MVFKKALEGARMANKSNTEESPERLLSLIAREGVWGHKVKLHQLDDEQRETIRAFDIRIGGLNQAVVKKAASVLVEWSISEPLEKIVLTDPEGPLMVQFLALNQKFLRTFDNLSGELLEIQLDELRRFASKLRPKTSQAPDPPDILSGGGGGGSARSSTKTEHKIQNTRAVELEWTPLRAISDDVFKRMKDGHGSEGSFSISEIYIYLSSSSRYGLPTDYGLPIGNYWMEDARADEPYRLHNVSHKTGLQYIQISYKTHDDGEHRIKFRALCDELREMRNSMELTN